MKEIKTVYCSKCGAEKRVRLEFSNTKGELLQSFVIGCSECGEIITIDMSDAYNAGYKLQRIMGA